MLNLRYLYFNFADVSSLASLYKENLPEIPKLKSIIENIKLLFKLPQTCIKVEVAEGERAYKITLLETGVHKVPFGFFVYLPMERRLDAFTINNPGFPLLQWKQKKLIYYGGSSFMEKAGASTLFNNLINIL